MYLLHLGLIKYMDISTHCGHTLNRLDPFHGTNCYRFLLHEDDSLKLLFLSCCARVGDHLVFGVNNVAGILRIPLSKTAQVVNKINQVVIFVQGAVWCIPSW